MTVTNLNKLIFIYKINRKPTRYCNETQGIQTNFIKYKDTVQY